MKRRLKLPAVADPVDDNWTQSLERIATAVERLAEAQAAAGGEGEVELTLVPLVARRRESTHSLDPATKAACRDRVEAAINDVAAVLRTAGGVTSLLAPAYASLSALRALREAVDELPAAEVER